MGITSKQFNKSTSVMSYLWALNSRPAGTMRISIYVRGFKTLISFILFALHNLFAKIVWIFRSSGIMLQEWYGPYPQLMAAVTKRKDINGLYDSVHLSENKDDGPPAQSYYIFIIYVQYRIVLIKSQSQHSHGLIFISKISNPSVWDLFMLFIIKTKKNQYCFIELFIFHYRNPN